MPASNAPLVEPGELRVLLKEHHISGFSDAQQWLLAARLWGGDWPFLANLMHVTPDALRRQFAGIVNVIVTPFGLDRHECFAAHWFDLHLNCEKPCLSHAKMRIENRIVFRIA